MNMRKIAPTLAAVLWVVSGPVAAQEKTSVADMRAILADIRDGTLDDFEVSPKLAEAFQRHKRKTRKNLHRVGQVEDVVYWDTYEGAELFLVSCEFGRLVIRVRRNDDGVFREFRWWAVAR